MPYTDFKNLPDESKTWVFAANRPLTDKEREAVAREVPNFLSQWTAHGASVPASFEIRDERFLVVAADERVSPGGCSIDALFRFVRALGDHLDVEMLDSGRVWYRDQAGEIRGADRPEFRNLAESGQVHEETPVFDTSLDDLGTYRRSFEQPARSSWTASML
ncbi:MAG: hypothetical protein R3338_15355 [Thermoanaerobaculia bacterium]|nr:hypothetical protein [Thermoanaerobaculia bacterium]